MSLLRRGFERLLLLGFAVARAVFLLQGLAFGCAYLAIKTAVPLEAPPWLLSVLTMAGLVSVTFCVAGVLLGLARRWPEPAAGRLGEPTPAWPMWLALSLLVAAALSANASVDLSGLWRQVAVWFASAGIGNDWARSASVAGIAWLVILLALFIPVLVTAAACTGVAIPLVLLPLLATRGRLFPRLLAMGTITQAALVLGSGLVVATFVQLVEQLEPMVAASRDVEVMALAKQVQGLAVTVTSTVLALIVPLLGMMGWLAFLRPGSAVAVYFNDGTMAKAGEVLGSYPARSEDSPGPRNPETAGAPPRPFSSATNPMRSPASLGVAGKARSGLVILGALLLVFAAIDQLRARPAYVKSSPTPMTTVTTAPVRVSVSFAAALDPASSLSITRLSSAVGEIPQDVALASRIAGDDPTGHTLEAIPVSALPVGLYRVEWQALPAGGGIARHGSFSFGVEVPVPADDGLDTYSLQERDAGARQRRHVVIGGVLLLGLGVLALRHSPRW